MDIDATQCTWGIQPLGEAVRLQCNVQIDLRDVAHAHEGESDEIQQSPHRRAHSRFAREIVDHPSAMVGMQSTVHAACLVATSTVLCMPKFVTIRAP
jgi:hypothetical protein